MGVCVEINISVDVLEGLGVGDGDAVFVAIAVNEGVGVTVTVSVGAGDVGDSSCLKGAAYRGCTLTSEIIKMMTDAPALSSVILFRRFESRRILIKELPDSCNIIVIKYYYIIHVSGFTSRMNLSRFRRILTFRPIKEFKSAS